MSSLDLSAYKPDPGDDGDATQVAGGFTTLEAFLNGNLPLVAHKQDGATPGQAIVWNGTQWAAATIATTSPSAELAYVERTTSVAIAATTEATATVVLTAPALTLDGATAILIEFFTPEAPQNTTAQEMWFVLYGDGAAIGVLGHMKFPYAATPFFGKRRITPAAGAHTYSVRAYRASAGSGGSPAINAGAGGVGQLVASYLRIARA